MKPPRAVVPLLLALSTPGWAHAQTPAMVAADQVPTPLAPASQAAPGAPATPSDALQGVQLPDVKDPMLLPVPDAEQHLSSWKDALALVRTRATALRISQAQVLQAVGATQQALAAALPRLTASASYSRPLIVSDLASSNPLFGRDNLGAGLDLRIPVVNVAGWYGVGTSREREKGAELSAKDQERLLLTAVASSAVTVITTSRIAESSRVSLASALSLLDLTKRRFALGAASAVDVLRAEQEVASSRALVVSSDESLRQAREALGQALGDPRPWGVADAVRIEDLEATATGLCKPIEALEARTDLKALKKTVDAADRDRKAVDYQFLPTLDLVGNVNWNKDPRFPANDHVNASVGAALTWQLYDGGTRYGLQKQTQGAATIAAQNLEQARRTATVQVAQTDRAILVAQTNLEVSTRARDLAKENLRLTMLAFMNGSGTSFELVQQQQALRSAEIDLLVKDFGVIQAKLAAYLAKANCSI